MRSPTRRPPPLGAATANTKLLSNKDLSRLTTSLTTPSFTFSLANFAELCLILSNKTFSARNQLRTANSRETSLQNDIVPNICI